MDAKRLNFPAMALSEVSISASKRTDIHMTHYTSCNSATVLFFVSPSRRFFLDSKFFCLSLRTNTRLLLEEQCGDENTARTIDASS